jgi:hypothetical protein
MIASPERAARLARVLMSDVAVYAGEDLRIGIEKDDLFDRLGPQLRQAAAYFFYHVDVALPDRERIFNHAVVDVLVCRHGGRATPIW